MTNLGLGVMIRMLSGREAIDLADLRSKSVDVVTVDDDVMTIAFTDGSKLRLKDEGQSCCEHRYMVCDDDLAYLHGAQFVNVELADGPEEEGEYGECHEVQFIKLTTSKGTITVASHNEHNGYYGGFSIEASIEAAPEPPQTPPAEIVEGARHIELED